MINMDVMMAELVRDEGVRLAAYDDATGLPIGPGTKMIGHPTIGIGRCLDLDGLTHAEVLILATRDINKYLSELDPLAWFAAMDGQRQRAIVNMRHQMGLKGLLGFRAMIAALVQGDWELAADSATQSLWYRDTPTRAARVLDLLRTGQAADPPKA